MATTEVVRPDANLAVAGWTIVGTEPTVWEALSEGHDMYDLLLGVTASYIQNTTAGADPADCRVEIGEYTLAADERCSRVRLKIIAKTTHTTWRGQAKFGSASETLTGPIWSSTAYGEHTSAWYYAKAGSINPFAGWAQADLDALQVALSVVNGSSGAGRVHIQEVWLELEVMKEAQAAWDNSYFSDDNINTPGLVWTYTGNGEVQKAYRIKIFTEADTLVGGFDPDVDTPEWDSGNVTSSLTAAIAPELPAGVAYVAYLKVAKDFNNATWFATNWEVSNVFIVSPNPEAQSLLPSGTITTNRPLLEWVYEDNNNAGSSPQTQYQTKVFTEPGAGWPGAGDPDDPAWLAAVGDPIFDSGVVNSSAVNQSMTAAPTPLPNNTNYRLYVQVRKTISGLYMYAQHISDWAFSNFDTDFIQPPTPLITAVVDPSKPCDVLVTVTPQAGFPTADYLDITRSIDGGPFEAFHIGNGLSSLAYDNPGIGTPFVLRDREAPFYKQITYRAESVDLSLGSPVSSVPAEADPTIEVPQVWLKVPMGAQSLDHHFMVGDSWLSTTIVSPRTVSTALGRRHPTTRRGTIRYRTFSVTFMIVGEEDRQALEDLLESPNTYFLQSPKGSWYVDLAGDVTELAHLWDALHNEEDLWQVTLPFVEVDSDVPGL